MKAAVTDGKGGLWIEDLPIPEPSDYQVLCKVHACASCTGTDLKHMKNALPWEQTYPGLLGHEGIGTVVKVGGKVRNIKEGEMFLRPALAYPGEKYEGYLSMWSGFAEYGLVTDVKALMEDDPEAKPSAFTRFQLRVPVEANIPPAEATMMITLKETASYAATSGVGFLKKVMVLGAGSVGIAMIHFAKVLGGTPVIAVARRDEQLAYAKDVIGADFVINAAKEDVIARAAELTGGEGVDVLLDTTGSSDFLASCMPVLAPEGKAGAYATYERGTDMGGVIPPERNAGGRTGEDIAHQYMLDAVRLGLVDLSNYYSHKVTLDELPQAFEMLKRKEAFKIVAMMED
ncbi:MAG: zinc-binding dehydrogenase [Lentisphaeria bacterium]|nr:zinc-binding dehydrogenase [Lentisphaeria bacterium]